MNRKKLSYRQIKYNKDTITWVPKKEVLTGLIGCQPGDWESFPIITIDGIELSWEEFARTMLVYEGFKFKLEFIDPTVKSER